LSGGKFDSTGKIYTATFTPTANIEDASNLISLSTAWSDAAGNAPAAVSTSVNYTIYTKDLAVISLTDAEAKNLIAQSFRYNTEQHVVLDFTSPEATVLKSTLSGLQKLGVDSVLGKDIINVVMGGMPVAGVLPSFEPKATVTLGVNFDELYELINIIKDDPGYFKNGNVDFLISEAGYVDLSDADAFILAKDKVVFSPEVDVRVVVDDHGNAGGTELMSSLVNLQKMGVDSIVWSSVINVMLGGLPVASTLPRFEPEAKVTLYVSDDELNGFIAAVVDGDIDPLYDVFGQQNIDYIASVDGDFNMDALTYTSLTSQGVNFTTKTSVLNLDGAQLNEKFNDDLPGN